jgi:hypothetical protein
MVLLPLAAALDALKMGGGAPKAHRYAVKAAIDLGERGVQDIDAQFNDFHGAFLYFLYFIKNSGNLSRRISFGRNRCFRGHLKVCSLNRV